MVAKMANVIARRPDKYLNLNDRLHPQARARLTATWRDAAFWWGKQYRLSTRRATGIVEVWVEFGTEQPNKKRDPSNWAPTIKAICDGFTTAAVWADDDSTHVRTYEPVFTDAVAGDSLRITLTWEEE